MNLRFNVHYKMTWPVLSPDVLIRQITFDHLCLRFIPMFFQEILVDAVYGWV